MNQFSLLTKLALSVALGTIIGLERETAHFSHVEEEKKKKMDPEDIYSDPIRLGGIRTYILVSLFGTISAISYNLGYPFLLYLSGASLGVLVLISYFITFKRFNAAGITTEIATIFTFLIGALIALDVIPVKTLIAISVVLVLVMSRKRGLQHFISNFKRSEILDIVEYFVVALVILPFLPNQDFALNDIGAIGQVLSAYGISLGEIGNVSIINPFKIWFIVALVSGINLFGYFLSRLFGQGRGLLVTGIVGGFLSSTATTQSLALKAKELKTKVTSQKLGGAALLASASSFVQVLMLVLPINSAFFVKASYPFLLMAAILATGGVILLNKAKGKKGKKETDESVDSGDPFALGPAVRFAMVLVLVRFVTKSAHILMGTGGFLVSTAVASVAGLDAVSINAAELSGKEIAMSTGILSIVLANAVNLAGKSVFSFAQGTKEFGKVITFFFIIATILGVILVPLIS